MLVPNPNSNPFGDCGIERLYVIADVFGGGLA
jgi:hypothetical protein